MGSFRGKTCGPSTISCWQTHIDVARIAVPRLGNETSLRLLAGIVRMGKQHHRVRETEFLDTQLKHQGCGVVETLST